MLGRLARIILLEDFLEQLRKAKTTEEILNALRAADQDIDSFFSSMEITQPRLRKVDIPASQLDPEED